MFLVDIVVLLSIFGVTLSDDRWLYSSYPNPVRNSSQCGHGTQDTYICDPDKLLSDIDAVSLMKKIAYVERSTSCPCGSRTCSQDNRGYKIGVALMNKMAAIDPSIKNLDELFNRRLDEATKFSYNTLQSWSLGQCGEDVVILYSLQDHVLYTMTGETSKALLTITQLSDIAIQYRKYFESGDYYTGLDKMIADYQAILSGTYKSPVPQAQPQVGALVMSGDASRLLTCLTTTGLVLLGAVLLH